MLGRPVGRFDVSVVEEGENLSSMFGQVILESAIVFLRALVRQQFIQPLFESPSRHGQSVVADPSGIAPIAKCERILKELLRPVRKSRRGACCLLQKFRRPSQQMLKALLMNGTLERIIRRPAVVDQSPVVVGPEDFLGNVLPTAGTNDVNRHRVRDEAAGIIIAYG